MAILRYEGSQNDEAPEVLHLSREGVAAITYTALMVSGHPSH